MRITTKSSLLNLESLEDKKHLKFICQVKLTYIRCTFQVKNAIKKSIIIHERSIIIHDNS